MTNKVTKVNVHVIKCDLNQPFSFSQGWVKQRSATLVEIETSDGLIGWGEASPQPMRPSLVSISTNVADLCFTHPCEKENG